MIITVPSLNPMMVVENANYDLKRYNTLTLRFSNHKTSFEEGVITVAAEFWNFNLNYSGTMLFRACPFLTLDFGKRASLGVRFLINFYL